LTFPYLLVIILSMEQIQDTEQVRLGVRERLGRSATEAAIQAGTVMAVVEGAPPLLRGEPPILPAGWAVAAGVLGFVLNAGIHYLFLGRSES
jgi:hypothetical protein